MNREIVCIMCPLGCRMWVRVEEAAILHVKGNKCKEGLEYAQQEISFPGRVLTTTIKTTIPEVPLLPVRTEKPIPKDQLENCMDIIARHVVTKPLIKAGEVVISSILGLDVHIISCATIGEGVRNEGQSSWTAGQAKS
jgi:CxxC motif-containing protein